MEVLKTWLSTWPGWGDTQLTMGQLQLLPNRAGLFLMDRQQKSWQKDLQGNVECLLRLGFRLLLCGDWSQRLPQLQNWIEEQSARGLAPVFGCRPHRERILQGQGRLEKIPLPGLPLYRLDLWVEFTKYWEAEDV